MPNKKRAVISLKKVFLITLFVLLGIVFFKIKKAHNKLPVLLRAAVVDLKLEEKGIKLSFEKASVTLVSSLSHPLGLRVKGLKAEQTKGCKLYKLDVETLVVPLKVMPLFKNKKIDLGLVRLGTADLKTENLCEKRIEKIPSVDSIKKRVQNQSRDSVEKKIVAFFKSLKSFHAEFLKQSQTTLKYKGVLIYDLKVKLSDSSKVFVSRFKALRGKGELKYKAEWDSILYTEDSRALVKGDLVGFEERLESVVYFKEKESELKADLISYSGLDKTDLLILNFKSVPLSYLSKIKKADFAGLNLRKTWLDSALAVEISSGALKVSVKNFRIYGDFGLVETDSNNPTLKWKDDSWSLTDSTQLKFQKINFFEILADRPQKKMAQVFKDVGSFNALVRLDSLDKFSGDFETNDFSVSIRSRGRKAYQKIKFARGSVSYQKKRDLTFNLGDVGLENGDFEGYIKFIYDYEKKEIKTDFDVQHLKFDAEVSKKLLGLDANQDFSIKGVGFISKTNLTEKSKENYQSALKFDLNSKLIKTAHWSSEGLNSKCNLKERVLNCKMAIDRLTISEILQKRLKLEDKKFTKVKSTSLVYKKKYLSADLKSSDQKINVAWSSKQGLVVSTPASQKVMIRQLK